MAKVYFYYKLYAVYKEKQEIRKYLLTKLKGMMAIIGKRYRVGAIVGIEVHGFIA